VHGHGPRAEELGAVHADVAAGGIGIAQVVGVDGVDAAEGDVPAAEAGEEVGIGADAGDRVVDVGGVADGGEVAVEGPALDDGKASQVNLAAGEGDLLAD